MKLTTKQLKQIIKEEINILLEIGDSVSYDFSDGMWSGSDFVYHFTTDREKGLLKYEVKFNVDPFAEIKTWEVDFNIAEDKKYNLTGQNDYRIMPTIVRIIQDFANNPKHGTEKLHSGDEKINFTFYGIKKQNEKGEGDSKRTKQYKWFLRKYGIDAVDEGHNNIIFTINRNI
jgi:hypothetical protein